MNRLDPRVQVVWGGQAVLTAALFGAVTAAVSAVTGGPWWASVAVFVAVLGVGVAFAVARYRRWGYELRADALYLERGVITQVRTVVPYVRIQHVDASRGPIERVVGLASGVVYTAGSRGADVTIPGLTPGGADDLQERLKRVAIRAEGEDAV